MGTHEPTMVVARTEVPAIRRASARLTLIGAKESCLGKQARVAPCLFFATDEPVPRGPPLLATVFVFITGNRVARVRGVVTIIINLDEARVPIGKSDDALGIAVKGRVGLACLASMPRERRMGRPFHYQ